MDKGANDLLQVSTTVLVVGAVFIAISWEIAIFAVLPIRLSFGVHSSINARLSQDMQKLGKLLGQ